MSISRKIKLILLLSGFILASHNAYAMMEEGEKGQLPKGLPVVEPLSADSNGLSLSSSPLPQRVVDELSARLDILKGGGMRPESSSSSSVVVENSIPKDVFDNISACLSPIGALLRNFEGSTVSSPKKRKSTKVKGKKDTFEISSPSTNMEFKSVEDFEKELPDTLRKFNLRFISVKRIKLIGEQKESFLQLLSSFEDVVKAYQKYNSDFQLLPPEKQRGHLKRRATIATLRNNSGNSSTLDMVLSLSRVSIEEVKLSKETFLSSPPLSPSTSPSSSPPPPRPLRSFEKPSPSSTPSSPLLSPRSKGSFPFSRPLPISPGKSSASSPLSLTLQQEGPSSPRQLPESSSSAPSTLFFIPPPVPSSFTFSSNSGESLAPSSPTSPPPNKRWAHYSKSPVDLSGQND